MSYEPWIELRILRKRSTLRQCDLAMLTGISESHLCNLEVGRRAPNERILAKLAEALDVPISMLRPAADTEAAS